MKRYFFMTSVLALTLAGCAKENQKDISQDSDSREMITVTIGASLPENTKTSIGDKEGSTYPVLWDEGDIISVNGVASSAAEISADRKYAEFTITVPTAESYTIIYPYTKGNAANEVSFSGTTLPMYAITSDLKSSVIFKPLYGVLKLSATGSGSISSIQITTQNDSHITGKFTLNSDGTLTPAESTATGITITPAEPVQLSKTASDFYIPVPAATYNIFDIQLFDGNGTSMTKKIGGSNAYKVTAGKVKEFPAFEYAVNKHLFAIASAEDLSLFASLVSDGSFASKYEGASLAGDIIMPEDWTSLDYSGIFKGNGHSITAKMPLFGTLTDAQVSGVNIDAKMTNSTSELNYGALAKAAAGSTAIDNCNVSGKVLLNLEGNATTNKFNFAGLVGLAGGSSIKDCQSTANVQIDHPGTGAKTICIGGIAGKLAAGTIYDCTINEQLIKANDSNGNSSVTIAIGGITGWAEEGTIIENCTIPKKSANSGVSVSARMNVGTYRAGGIAGNNRGTIRNCSNAQGISLSKSKQEVSYGYIGGICGSASKGEISGCSNAGTLFFGNNKAANTVAKTVQLRMGGIVGTSSIAVSSCTNSGIIEYCGNASNATWFAVGGIAGYMEPTNLVVDGLKNSGNILIHPSAQALGNSSAGFQIGVGGLIGIIPKDITLTMGENSSSNSGKIDVTTALAPETATSNNYAYVGGCIGCYRGGKAVTYTLENTGDLLIGIPKNEDSTTNYTELDNITAGGIIGHTSAGSTTKATFDGCKVNCKIVNKTAEFTGPALLCGWSGNNKIYKNCLVAGSVNDTEITADNYASYLFVGGTPTDGKGNGIIE